MSLTPLEPWILKKIHSQGQQLNRGELEAFQLERLRHTLRDAWQNSPFYRTHLSGYPLDLEKLEDLSRLPFTTSADISRAGLQMLCVSQSEIERVVTLQTSGTTGEPKRIFFTSSDQELTIDFFQQGMATFTEAGDRVLILLPGQTPGSVGDLLAKGLERLGAQAIHYGPVRDPLDTIQAIRENGITCLVGAPAHLLALARFWNFHKESGPSHIHSVLLSTDYVPKAIIDVIEAAWNCKVFNHYGMTEMGLGGGVECQARRGYHLREADLLFEIVDPQTGASLPDGETGEVVFTTLTRIGMPLIRYRTRDLGRFLPGACPCGAHLRTLEKIRYRLNGLISLEVGNGLPPVQFGMADLDEALFPIAGLLNFSAEVINSGMSIKLLIRVITLPEGASGMEERARLALKKMPSLAPVFQENALGLDLTIENYHPGQIGSLAKRMVVDRRGIDI